MAILLGWRELGASVGLAQRFPGALPAVALSLPAVQATQQIV